MIRVYIENALTGIYKAQRLYLDESGTKLIAKFTMTDDMQNGEWKLRFIALTDNVGNKIYYHEDDLEKQYTDVVQFRNSLA